MWHPSVTVYDVIDGARKVGRIYLDMHPREGKDKWFSSLPVVPGIRGKQLPEGCSSVISLAASPPIPA